MNTCTQYHTVIHNDIHAFTLAHNLTQACLLTQYFTLAHNFTITPNDTLINTCTQCHTHAHLMTQPLTLAPILTLIHACLMTNWQITYSFTIARGSNETTSKDIRYINHPNVPNDHEHLTQKKNPKIQNIFPNKTVHKTFMKRKFKI